MLTDERRGCLAPHAHAALILERCALQGAVRMEGQLTFLAKREREAKKNKPKLGHMPGVVENLRMTSTVVDTGNGKLSSFFFPYFFGRPSRSSDSCRRSVWFQPFKQEPLLFFCLLNIATFDSVRVCWESIFHPLGYCC